MITIRKETADDYAQITEVIDQAFDGMPYAAGDESDVVPRLRAADALTLGLVAERDGQFVGHIAFSPVSAEDGSENWFALGPVAVYPQFQPQGIGGQLIVDGLERLKDLGASGCMLTGNPSYHQRFGFKFSPPYCTENVPAEYFMVKRLSEQALPGGRLNFHRAFYE